MESQAIIKMTRLLIKQSIGGLEDLPRELANTIANIYFKMASGSNTNDLLASMVRNKSYGDFVQREADLVSKFKAIPDYVRILRECDQKTRPNEYKFMVDFLLDSLKYDIKNLEKKTGLRRMVERKFKKIEEIPNLIEVLSLEPLE